MQVSLSASNVDMDEGRMRLEDLTHFLHVVSLQHQARMNSEDEYAVADKAVDHLSAVLDTLHDIASVSNRVHIVLNFSDNRTLRQFPSPISLPCF